jgi:predicted SprT family Zn-dependent metalloprotease
MKLHIKKKRYRNNPKVYCEKSINFFKKVEKHEVEELIEFHGTEDNFCKKCLKKYRDSIKLEI